MDQSNPIPSPLWPERRDALHQVVKHILARRELADVFQEIQRQACKLFDVDLGSVALWQKTAGVLRLVATYGASIGGAGRDLIPGRSLLELAFRLGTAQFANDDGSSPFADEVTATEGARTALAVPIRLLTLDADGNSTDQERVVGALAVADRAGRLFREEDAALLSIVADQAALAIEQAQLLDALTRSEARFRQAANNLRAARAAVHDIVQPLSIIMGQAELLLVRETSLTASARDGIEEISKASDRLIDTIDQLRALVRLEDSGVGPGREQAGR